MLILLSPLPTGLFRLRGIRGDSLPPLPTGYLSRVGLRLREFHSLLSFFKKEASKSLNLPGKQIISFNNFND
jgi:hypothetical protein